MKKRLAALFFIGAICLGIVFLLERQDVPRVDRISLNGAALSASESESAELSQESVSGEARRPADRLDQPSPPLRHLCRLLLPSGSPAPHEWAFVVTEPAKEAWLHEDRVGSTLADWMRTGELPAGVWRARTDAAGFLPAPQEDTRAVAGAPAFVIALSREGFWDVTPLDGDCPVVIARTIKLVRLEIVFPADVPPFPRKGEGLELGGGRGLQAHPLGPTRLLDFRLYEVLIPDAPQPELFPETSRVVAVLERPSEADRSGERSTLVASLRLPGFAPLYEVLDLEAIDGVREELVLEPMLVGPPPSRIRFLCEPPEGAHFPSGLGIDFALHLKGVDGPHSPQTYAAFDAAGSFVFAGVVPGVYSLHARSFRFAGPEVDLTEHGVGLVTIPPNGTTDVRIPTDAFAWLLLERRDPAPRPSELRLWLARPDAERRQRLLCGAIPAEALWRTKEQVLVALPPGYFEVTMKPALYYDYWRGIVPFDPNEEQTPPFVAEELLGGGLYSLTLASR